MDGNSWGFALFQELVVDYSSVVVSLSVKRSGELVQFDFHLLLGYVESWLAWFFKLNKSSFSWSSFLTLLWVIFFQICNSGSIWLNIWSSGVITMCIRWIWVESWYILSFGWLYCSTYLVWDCWFSLEILWNFWGFHWLGLFTVWCSFVGIWFKFFFWCSSCKFLWLFGRIRFSNNPQGLSRC